MRKITKESVLAFIEGKNFNKSNMNVVVNDNGVSLRYQGNTIAYKNSDGVISITNCGWATNTTKERLNGVIRTIYGDQWGIVQKDGTWYICTPYTKPKTIFKNNFVLEQKKTYDKKDTPWFAIPQDKY